MKHRRYVVARILVAVIVSAWMTLVFCVFASPTVAENWPRFRGPTGMGITSERDLPLTWGDKEQNGVLWKVRLPGSAAGAKAYQNQSSPIIWQDRIFVMTAFWPAGHDQKEFPVQLLSCLSLVDGKTQWEATIEPGPWKLSDLRGGYAAPTPATDGERVYALFGSAVLVAVDFGGKVIWRHELPDPQSFDVAIATSPIVHDGAVILLADRNNKKSTLTAYDSRTGDAIWEQKRPQVAFNHSTPVIADVDGRRQMLVTASNALQGHGNISSASDENHENSPFRPRAARLFPGAAGH